MNNVLDRLVLLITNNLPDSVAAQQEVLKELLSALPDDYERRPAVRLMLAHLERAQQAQLDLALEIKENTKTH